MQLNFVALPWYGAACSPHANRLPCPRDPVPARSAPHLKRQLPPPQPLFAVGRAGARPYISSHVFFSAFPSAIIFLSLGLGMVHARMLCVEAVVPRLRTPCGEESSFPPAGQASMSNTLQYYSFFFFNRTYLKFVFIHGEYFLSMALWS